jgi:hypothetical protein
MNRFKQEEIACRHAIQRAIGEQLRAMYESRSIPAMPPDLRELMNKLCGAQRAAMDKVYPGHDQKAG